MSRSWQHFGGSTEYGCDGSVRVPSSNPLETSLGYHSRLFTINPSEEETVIFSNYKSTIYSQSFPASMKRRRERKPGVRRDCY
ncbi:hypothetical protein TNCV_3584031 [Trichonephila clavipes]|nr:hypothetical protein TNCV_3584031 [Trichonephila clavipes]